MRPCVSCVALLALISACSHRSPQSSAPQPGPSATPKGTLAIGERITQPLVSLADIAKNPGQYANRVVATAGKVTAVCQEMGCWMEMQDESGRAHVRMHGHSFFVPKTASGHMARVQAKVVTGPPSAAGEDCVEGTSQLSKIELEANGVELD